MTDDLVLWLRAQLDADERIAREAGGLAWYRPAEYLGDPAAIRDSEQERVVCYEGWPSEGQAVHIVAHDPARVLREIEAKRRMLDECVRAVDYDSRGMMSMAEDFLRLLALPFADRPGFQESWRP